MDHPFFDVEVPTIIGHRGAAGTAPENTLPTFERALSLGAEVLESDIHVTRDGVPVLIHDPDVARTTEATGEVAGFDFAELQELDAGFRFSHPDGEAGGFPMRGTGVHIPSLEQAFERFPNARFNLEIKAPGPALAERVIDLVEAFERSDLTLLTAGENDIMASLRDARAKRGARFAIGACTADVVACVKAAAGSGQVPEDVMALQIPDAFAGGPLVTPEFVAFAKQHCIAMHVWTINEAEEMQRLLGLGVEGIITDHPERMAALLGRG